MPRLTFNIDEQHWWALAALAAYERRTARDQAAVTLEQALDNWVDEHPDRVVEATEESSAA